MPSYQITGYDMDYHGKVVESFIKDFPNLEEAREWAIANEPLGVRYGVEPVDPNARKTSPGVYRHTIIDDYMKRGKI